MASIRWLISTLLTLTSSQECSQPSAGYNMCKYDAYGGCWRGICENDLTCKFEYCPSMI